MDSTYSDIPVQAGANNTTVVICFTRTASPVCLLAPTVSSKTGHIQATARFQSNCISAGGEQRPVLNRSEFQPTASNGWFPIRPRQMQPRTRKGMYGWILDPRVFTSERGCLVGIEAVGRNRGGRIRALRTVALFDEVQLDCSIVVLQGRLTCGRGQIFVC